MVVEVPRWTNAKYEISRSDVLNPIHQDGEKTGPPRFVKNRFPHHGYIWNYGALPQTWEDPHYVDKDTKARGDNDPIDACDISQHVSYAGEVQQVKVLGILALIDSGETDWKLIVIDLRDPRTAELHDINDVERLMPGYLAATREWFRLYKFPDGHPKNDFAFGGHYRNREFALKIIYECSGAWERLITGKTEPGDVNRSNVTAEGSPFRVDSRKLHIPKGEDLPPAPLPKHVEEWFFLSSGDNPG
ncbi:hypothetical protein PV04_02713 [Phialophora macrospora]|uniref:inorganic diphosphatase n=1 Tax=Phialophora macrospora TaxID=1851006 RepID=A0A0D2GE71_9EURO|nr:hypothetical protein PV04_02713 [Phialophora macrospora]